MRMHVTSHLGAVTAGAAILPLGVAGVAAPTAAGAASPACRAPAAMVYVANGGSGTVTPIHAATNTVGKSITVAAHPLNIAITPNGRELYVASDTTVTPVNTASGMAGKAITVGGSTQIIAAAPNGKAVYAVSLSPGTVTPISTRTNKAGTPISVPGAGSLAIAPNGKTVYVLASSGVVPIRAATSKAGPAIKASGDDITVTPNGKTVYVVDGMGGVVTPIRTATSQPGKPVHIPANPNSSPWGTPGQTLIVSAPDSKTVYAASQSGNTVTPISTATNRAGKPIKVGKFPYSMAISPNGKTLVVVNQDDTVSLINTVTDRVTSTVKIPAAVVVWYMTRPVTISPDGKTAYVTDYQSNAVTPISLATGKAGKLIAVGESPIAITAPPAPPAHR